LRTWRSFSLITCCVFVALAGCSADDSAAGQKRCTGEPGSVTDVDSEPDWRRHAEYRTWTDTDGCLLRIDVVAERPGPSHCGRQDADVLIVGEPLGERYGSTSVQFVRDPEGVFGLPELAEGFVANDELPEAAVDSGFRREGSSLWHVPGDQAQVWLVADDAVERWPRGDPPICS
jgi:hypothetical protein